jgi:outer membrane protein TolC
MIRELPARVLGAWIVLSFSGVVGADEPAATPLALARAQELALANNPGFAVTREDVNIAAAQIKLARGAFAPHFMADARFTYNHDPGNFFFPEFTDQQLNAAFWLEGRAPIGLDYKLEWTHQYDHNDGVNTIYDPTYRTTLRLSLTQQLLRNGWLTVNRAPGLIATLRRDANRFLQQAEAERILGDVEFAYWQLARAYQELEIRRRAMELASRQVADSRTSHKLGAASQIDVAEAEAALARQAVEFEASRQDITEAEGQLKTVLQSVDPTIDYLPVDAPEVQPPAAPVGEMIATALKRRPDLAAARANLDAERVGLTIARNRLWPALDVVGNIGITGFSGTLTTGLGTAGFNVPDAMNYLTGKQLAPYRPDPSLETEGLGKTFENLRFLSGMVGLRLDVALDNSAAIAGKESQEAQMRRQRALVEQLEKRAGVEVATAEKRLRVDLERIRATAEAVRLAEVLLDGQRKRFLNGVAVSFDVLRANDELTRARIVHLRAQLNGRISQARLALAQGIYLDNANVKIAPRPKE